MKTKTLLSCLFLFLLSASVTAQGSNPLEGKWDLVISVDGKELPSWLEVYKSGNKTLVGRFVYAFGSARPIAHVKVDNEGFNFSIPPQWEQGDLDMQFQGTLKDDRLTGTMRYSDGKSYSWTGTRAPKLANPSNPIWGEPKALFNGTDLSGWKVLGESQWVVADGLLKNVKSGGNLVSQEVFQDFKLHAEFRYPEGSNSGIYLRGRYEVQIEDNHGRDPSKILFASIYGFLPPNEMAAKPAGEWQEFDITLIGRKVSIVANGKEVVTNQNIPGITGGALDSKEGEPGPFLIQGDHGPIEFRSIIVTPAISK